MIVDREIIYDDEWKYDSENQLYVSSTGEIWTEEEFEHHISEMR